MYIKNTRTTLSVYIGVLPYTHICAYAFIYIVYVYVYMCMNVHIHIGSITSYTYINEPEECILCNMCTLYLCNKLKKYYCRYRASGHFGHFPTSFQTLL